MLHGQHTLSYYPTILPQGLDNIVHCYLQGIECIIIKGLISCIVFLDVENKGW